ncbi:interleukin-13 receptor subunit alpha-2-like isoform X2 [Megalops cyprinoides]|uniref:interleukin-13 receptor subunit alpha-2-like isoform X2 n=1 Tax=Megalops cyprinoides TaxID=118141 RepID=UPI001864928D|nr:interleukin-13 receptor subunit alpha-2-like isoform X2 [Megalops cyprinoides]
MLRGSWRGILALIFSIWASGADGADLLPAPTGVALRWVDDFCVNLTWNPPAGLDMVSCVVTYLVEKQVGQNSTLVIRKDLFYDTCELDRRREVNFTVKTRCGSQQDSQAAWLSLPPAEELVRDFRCVYYQSELMNCTWQPVSGVSDLRLHYRPVSGGVLEPCRVQFLSGDQRTGCHLNTSFLHGLNPSDVYFLFSAAKGSSVLRDTFKIVPNKHVKVPPPVVMIQSDGKTLKWDPPIGFDPHCWDYEYKYSKSERVQVIIQETQATVPAARGRRDSVQVRAVYSDRCGDGGSEWSQEMLYGEPAGWDSHIALGAVAVGVSIAVAVILVLHRRLQRHFHSQVPDPKMVIKGMFGTEEESQEEVVSVITAVERAVPPAGHSPTLQAAAVTS